jgi:hypothetical protein
MSLKIKLYFFLCNLSDCFKGMKQYENIRSLYPEDD